MAAPTSTRLVRLDAEDVAYLAEMHGSDVAYARRLINCSTAPQRDKIMAKVALADEAYQHGYYTTTGTVPYDQDAAANADYDWAPPPRPTPLGSLRFLLLAALIVGGTALAVLAVTG